MVQSQKIKQPFFTRDRAFYKTLFRLMTVVIIQNIISYSVNMADNLMLGAYSQNAFSGAATVNMIQFMTQQITMAIADGVVVLGSQYWGQKRTEPIRKIAGVAITVGIFFGTAVFLWTALAPRSILLLFTQDEAYIAEGLKYLNIVKFTYPLYIISAILLGTMRSVETVSIALKISISSLILDVAINYPLIYGKFGCPEMGIEGAAVGTLVARIVEFIIIVCYVIFKDKKLKLFAKNPFAFEKELTKSYFKVFIPSVTSNALWSIATPIQTSILGHLSSDAIAANSASTTMFQYLKIVAIGEASASAVLIGKSVGSGKSDEDLHAYTRTLQILYIAFALVLSTALFFIRIPFLKMYDMTPEARKMANQILIMLCFIFLGMAYQMPASCGIVNGGGNVKFTMYMNIISIWAIVMPLSFLAAFYWNLPIVWIVAILNSDQIFKCLPVALRTNSYKWIKRLTK